MLIALAWGARWSVYSRDMGRNAPVSPHALQWKLSSRAQSRDPVARRPTNYGVLRLRFASLRTRVLLLCRGVFARVLPAVRSGFAEFRRAGCTDGAGGDRFFRG